VYKGYRKIFSSYEMLLLALHQLWKHGTGSSQALREWSSHWAGAAIGQEQPLGINIKGLCRGKFFRSCEASERLQSADKHHFQSSGRATFHPLAAATTTNRR